MMDTKILVVDDDPNISDLLKIYFENEGYEVKTVGDGAEGINYFKMYEPDLVLLDIMLPKKDGWQVCREIREISSKPVIMITAKGEVFDKVLGLELGADDFVVKPFDMKELSARVKAVLRRYQSHTRQSDDEVIKFENIEISLQKYELKLRGKSVDIPPKELELLYFLASNYNRVFTRDQLLDKVWGFDYLGDSRTVDVHVKRLREKLDGVSDRDAQFVCCIALVFPDSPTVYADGVCHGSIALAPSGTNGFGYDPLFVPSGYTDTMAMLSGEEKNKISHRALAVADLKKRLDGLK